YVSMTFPAVSLSCPRPVGVSRGKIRGIPMKINHLTTLFAILATMLFAVACGEETTTEEPTAATEPAADEATEAADPAADEAEPAAEEPAAAADEPAAAAGGSVC